MIGRSEQHVLIHQQYQESLQAAVDWLSQMKDKLALCSDSSGDRTTIQNKLDRLKVHFGFSTMNSTQLLNSAYILMILIIILLINISIFVD
jgi:hypothetical protein